MKIRSDFVTNSSSSSFVGIFAATKDSESHFLADVEDGWYDLGEMPYLKKGKLYYRRGSDGKAKEIETVGELMGALAAPMYSNELLNNEFVYVFRYKLGDIEHEDLAKEIFKSKAFEYYLEDYESADDLAEAMDEFMEMILEENYLPFNNGEDDDECYDEDNEIENFLSFARENTLDDISTISVSVNDFERDEGINQFIERLAYLIEDGDIEFHQMDREDPAFEETVERLMEQIEDLVFEGKNIDYFDSLEELVEMGLESGEAWQMIPNNVSIEEEQVIDFTKYKG